MWYLTQRKRSHSHRPGFLWRCRTASSASRWARSGRTPCLPCTTWRSRGARPGGQTRTWGQRALLGARGGGPRSCGCGGSARLGGEREGERWVGWAGWLDDECGMTAIAPVTRTKMYNYIGNVCGNDKGRWFQMIHRQKHYTPIEWKNVWVKAN